MPSIDILSAAGEQAGTADLPAQLFEARVSETAVHQAVVTYEANQRQGNASVKGRSEVNRSKRKHHRQKGTGQARRGTATTNLLRGGGAAFSLPKPRSYHSRLPRTVRRKALRSVLTAKSQEGQVLVVEGFDLAEPSTKAFAAMLSACGLRGKKVLYITASNAPEVAKSGRNIPGVEVRTASTFGTYDVLAADVLLIASDAIDTLVAVHGDRPQEGQGE
jgi:large subunit ribosomal protein L4